MPVILWVVTVCVALAVLAVLLAYEWVSTVPIILWIAAASVLVVSLLVYRRARMTRLGRVVSATAALFVGVFGLSIAASEDLATGVPLTMLGVSMVLLYAAKAWAENRVFRDRFLQPAIDRLPGDATARSRALQFLMRKAGIRRDR